MVSRHDVPVKAPRILIAGVPETYGRLSTILANYTPHFANTFHEATAFLKSMVYDLVLIGVHFDESRMFDLLRYLKASDRHAQVLVVCYRATAGAETRTELTMQAVELACRVLGASGFLDLFQFPNEDAGNLALRKLVDQSLAAHRVPRFDVTERLDC